MTLLIGRPQIGRVAMGRVEVDGGRAVIRCNHCRQPIHAMHRKRHLAECSAYQARQKLGRINFERNGKKLYAIAIQRLNRATQTWDAEMHYAHANSPAEAKRAYLATETKSSSVHIVDVGLAIGMFAADRDGKVLVAD